MKIIFYGTKGEIEEQTQKHKYHSSIILEYKRFRLLLDYGEKTLPLKKIKPDAILITHAHPDHYAWTIKNIETNKKIYALKQTIDYGKFKPQNYKIITPNKKFKIGPFIILPYKVIHSLRVKTIGFKIKIGKKTLIYNPDLIDIINKKKILEGVDYYIGDGSSIKANLVRRKNNKLFGHARITTQINWCKKAGIKNIIFTHLGKETLRKEKEFKKSHPEITFAFDSMKLK